MLPTASDVERYVADRLRLTSGRGHERMARCPNPAGHAHCDKTASFSINLEKVVGHCHVCGLEGTITAIARQVGWDDPPWARANGRPRSRRRPDTWHGKPITEWYDYGPYSVARVEYKLNGQRKKEFPVWCGDSWGLKGKGVTRRLFNQVVLKTATDVLVVEGEKDVLRLKALGLAAVCNLGGAGKWKPEDADRFTSQHHPTILPDNDAAGRRHVETVAQSLVGRVASVKVVPLPGLSAKGDVSDFFAARPDQDAAIEELLRIIDGTDAYVGESSGVEDQLDRDEAPTPEAGVGLEDFRAYMPQHAYIFAPSRDLWPAASVNARIPPIALVNADGNPILGEDGKPRRVTATTWLDQHHPVEQMTWMPGMPMLIADRLVSEGGWIDRHGCTTFNLYRPPRVQHGDPKQARPWSDHIQRIYPDDADHIVRWLAHRAQRPHEKINHALGLGGLQGIGKDTLLEPVKAAVGPWNFIRDLASPPAGPV